VREWLEQLEAEDDPRAALAWLAGREVAIGDEELNAARRRAMLLLAAGGDPQRALEFEGRAVTALAAELDSQERRGQLTEGLAQLRNDAVGLPQVGEAIDALLEDPDLAWRGLACGLLAEELADD
jgi:hypothetical protein